MVVVGEDAVRVSLERKIDDSYSIVFGSNLFGRIAKEQRERWPRGTKFAIITDSNVLELYAGSLEEALKNEGLDVNVFSFEAGEKNKRIETCVGLNGRMVESGYGTDSVVLNLGGGVVSDVGGFTASTYKRSGCPYINIGTSFLAMADASVGGKTAVNTVHGKNLIGVINQPAGVYSDFSTLKTLPVKEYSYGSSETIKHAVVMDAVFFDYLWENADVTVMLARNSGMTVMLARNSGTLLHISKQNCIIKGNVVEKDPEEKGLRRILNYGHTIGHALETLTNYELPHGAAVSIGMMAEARMAARLSSFSELELVKQKILLSRFGLPVRIPEGITDNAIIKATYIDKKAEGGRPRYALPSSIGRMNEFGGAYATPVDDRIVKAALKATR